ncbi:hypothetical protein ACCO45_003885 [Purpureocillium lilacinum]|uniref:Uncharacterized protein n=1 Tax=Purpureocillium lilacinum TaxID=33203 RepID=A0ACC4E179_PURLI
MRRLNLALLATFQLCRARTPGFNVHSDLLAYPQYEVIFADGAISDKDAQSLLDRDSQHHPTYSADFTQPTAGDSRDGNVADAPEEAPRTHSCLYFMSGWWSYSFCNNREIVQFHAMAAVPNGQPPRPDPHTQEYVLGRVPTIPATSERQGRQKSEQGPPVPAELQVKGDQRYLVQKLEKGTVCDLTGRDRTIEVQYHCVPGMKSDRIGWIKEANPISCQLIADVDAATQPLIGESKPVKTDAPEPHEEKEEEAKAEAAKESEVTIGGVVVGGRRVLSSADEAGKPPVKLTPPRNYLSGQAGKDRLIEVVVQAASKADGGKITTLDAAELEKLDLKPDVVKEMTKQMQDIAGDSGWKLEIVELEGEDLRERRQKKAPKDEAPDKAEGKDDGSEEKFFKEEL